MKKVLAITLTKNPRSGIGRYSEAVINGLVDQGVSVFFLTENKESGSVYTLKAPRAVLAIISNMLTARRYAKEIGAETVHAFDVWPYGLYAYAAVAGTKRKLIVSGVGTYSVPPKKISLKRMLFWIILRNSSTILCISNYTKRRILREFPRLQNTVVVPIAASPLPIPEDNFIEKAKVKFGLSDAYPILVTVGEIKDRKGQLDTVQAVQLLKNEYPEIVYCAVGSNSDKSYIESIHSTIKENNLSSNVKILSGLDDLEIASLYSLADVFILASNNDDEHGHFEGFGIVFLEAGQFGVPSVGTRDCGIEDAIQEGINGYLVHQRNPGEIADAVNRILKQNPQALKEGAKKVAASFSWSRTVKEYISYY